MVRISEYWLVKDEKARSLWVAYCEPKAILELLESSTYIEIAEHEEVS
jgi:hypothetical protein